MIRDLQPCTQLYVSIDAATRDALKAVDRPLFPDFWERFLASIDALRLKDIYQRTVFRMTLVKQWNMDMKEECERYANLIQRLVIIFFYLSFFFLFLGSISLSQSIFISPPETSNFFFISTLLYHFFRVEVNQIS